MRSAQRSPEGYIRPNKGAPLKSPGTVLRTRMNADHADLNPRVSAQIRVPFNFCVFLKLKTSECERRILSLAGLESNTLHAGCRVRALPGRPRSNVFRK